MSDQSPTVAETRDAIIAAVSAAEPERWTRLRRPRREVAAMPSRQLLRALRRRAARRIRG